MANPQQKLPRPQLRPQGALNPKPVSGGFGASPRSNSASQTASNNPNNNPFNPNIAGTLAEEIQNNSKTKGAFGAWGQNPNGGYSPNKGDKTSPFVPPNYYNPLQKDPSTNPKPVSRAAPIVGAGVSASAIKNKFENLNQNQTQTPVPQPNQTNQAGQSNLAPQSGGRNTSTNPNPVRPQNLQQQPNNQFKPPFNNQDNGQSQTPINEQNQTNPNNSRSSQKARNILELAKLKSLSNNNQANSQISATNLAPAPASNTSTNANTNTTQSSDPNSASISMNSADSNADLKPVPRSNVSTPRAQKPQNPNSQQSQQAQKPKSKGFLGGLFGGNRNNKNSTPIFQSNSQLQNNNQTPQSRPQNQNNSLEVDKNSTAYLSRLSSSQLRKEVVQTEIDIQKKLIESDKAYREGISTIRDLIAPSSIKIQTGNIELGTKLTRSFFVLTYPRVINSGWLEGMVNADISMDLSIFIYPRDSGEVLKELKGKVGKIQASLQLNSERGAARDPALETAYRDVEGLRDAIQQGVEKFFRVGVYITVYANTVDELEKLSQAVESILAQQNIIMKRAALQMDDGFNASLPILKDDLAVFSNMNTSPLSASFPFVSSELSSNDGILYGINRHNTSLIIFDRFGLENANSVVFATSGAGKSYAVKLEILRSLMLGIGVIVIDPEQEYKVLADTLGGTYVNFSLNSTSRINPFDLPKPLPGESSADILRSAIIDLMGLMNLMLGKLNPSEESLMERAIQESYAKRDITADSDFKNVTVPTMSDLVEILNGIVGGESLAQRLYRYTEGTFAGIFNQRTNININNEFLVFSIRDLQETLRPIAMYILLKFIWNEIRSELKKRILTIDEAWIMMQYEDSAKFLYGLVKRARKYYLGVTTITQDVGDFLNSPFGKPIVTNAAMKILLKQSTAAIDLVATTFALTDGEKQVLLQSEVGQGIFFAGPRHVAIEIFGFPTEHRIITTNPKDILKMQGIADSKAAGEYTEGEAEE